MQITHDLKIGGLQQVVVNLCKNINKDTFDVSILCLKALGSYTSKIEDCGVEVMFLPQPLQGTDYLSFMKVGKILRRNKIQIIHTHNTNPLIDGGLGGLIAHTPVMIHTDHAREFPDKKRYMLIEHFLSHLFYKFVGVSMNTAENLIKFEKISPKKIDIIPNGIDLSVFKKRKVTSDLIKELGIKFGNPTIGVVGRLSMEKGVSVILRAMPDIIREFPSVLLMIVGEGPIEAVLKMECGNMGIENNVLFTGPRTDISQLYHLFDLLVLPSLREGLPMVLLEAMAAEIPIVASKVGGIPALIKDGKNGLLFEVSNYEMLAQKVKKLVKNKRLRMEIINRNSSLVKKYSVQEMTRNYEQIYLKGFSRFVNRSK